MSSEANKENPNLNDEAVAQRAYEIWESRGCPEGDGGDDWETAKLQLLSESEPAEATSEPASHSRRGPLLRLFDRLRNRAAL